MQFEGRLKQLEVDLHRHHETVGKLKHTIKQLINNSPVPDQFRQHLNHTVTTTSTITAGFERDVSCSIQFRSVPRTDIQVSNYEISHTQQYGTLLYFLVELKYAVTHFAFLSKCGLLCNTYIRTESFFSFYTDRILGNRVFQVKV